MCEVSDRDFFQKVSIDLWILLVRTLSYVSICMLVVWMEPRMVW